VEVGSVVQEILDGITFWYCCFDCFAGTFKFKQNSTKQTRDLSSSNRGRLLKKCFDDSKSPWIV